MIQKQNHAKYRLNKLNNQNVHCTRIHIGVFARHMYSKCKTLQKIMNPFDMFICVNIHFVELLDHKTTGYQSTLAIWILLETLHHKHGKTKNFQIETRVYTRMDRRSSTCIVTSSHHDQHAVFPPVLYRASACSLSLTPQ